MGKAEKYCSKYLSCTEEQNWRDKKQRAVQRRYKKSFSLFLFHRDIRVQLSGSIQCRITWPQKNSVETQSQYISFWNTPGQREWNYYYANQKWFSLQIKLLNNTRPCCKKQRDSPPIDLVGNNHNKPWKRRKRPKDLHDCWRSSRKKELLIFLWSSLFTHDMKWYTGTWLKIRENNSLSIQRCKYFMISTHIVSVLDICTKKQKR